MNTHEFVSPRDALDIVFANRNRAYGAYQLRRAYSRYLGRAFGLGLMLIGLALVLPQILNAVSSAFPEKPALDVEIVMGPPPVIENTPPPPLPPPLPTPPPPVRATVRFVPPAPTPDELVRDEQPPSQEDVLNTDAEVGTKNIESDNEALPTLDEADFPREAETVIAKSDEGEYDLVTVQKPPTFPGGEHDLLKYLAENIKYPPLARETNIQGTVALTFVVGKDGSVSDVSILKDIGGGCGKEAMRVVQAMPRWIPGEANGHAVKVRFTLPVKFRLQ
ncbi:MAG: energy transducer TonB [Saprospiraceae bacterium]